MLARIMTAMLAVGLFACVGCSQNEKEQTFNWQGHTASKDIDASRVKEAEDPNIKPMTFVAAGRVLEQQGNLQGAREQYEKAIVADPRYTPAYNQLGMLYQKLGRAGDAARIYKSGIEATPGSAILHNNLGFIYLTEKRYAEARTSFEQALMYAPEFKRARMNLGIALARLGKFGNSVSEFSRVVPAAVAYYNVGVICADDHDWANAEKAFEEALAIDSSCKLARDQLSRVRYLANAGRAGEGRQDTPAAGALAGEVEEVENAGP